MKNDIENNIDDLVKSSPVELLKLINKKLLSSSNGTLLSTKEEAKLASLANWQDSITKDSFAQYAIKNFISDGWKVDNKSLKIEADDDDITNLFLRYDISATSQRYRFMESNFVLFVQILQKYNPNIITLKNIDDKTLLDIMFDKCIASLNHEEVIETGNIAAQSQISRHILIIWHLIHIGCTCNLSINIYAGEKADEKNRCLSIVKGDILTGRLYRFNASTRMRYGFLLIYNTIFQNSLVERFVEASDISQTLTRFSEAVMSERKQYDINPYEKDTLQYKQYETEKERADQRRHAFKIFINDIIPEVFEKQVKLNKKEARVTFPIRDCIPQDVIEKVIFFQRFMISHEALEKDNVNNMVEKYKNLEQEFLNSFPLLIINIPYFLPIQGAPLLLEKDGKKLALFMYLMKLFCAHKKSLNFKDKDEYLSKCFAPLIEYAAQNKIYCVIEQIISNIKISNEIIVMAASNFARQGDEKGVRMMLDYGMSPVYTAFQLPVYTVFQLPVLRRNNYLASAGRFYDYCKRSSLPKDLIIEIENRGFCYSKTGALLLMASTFVAVGFTFYGVKMIEQHTNWLMQIIRPYLEATILPGLLCSVNITLDDLCIKLLASAYTILCLRELYYHSYGIIHATVSAIATVVNCLDRAKNDFCDLVSVSI